MILTEAPSAEDLTRRLFDEVRRHQDQEGTSCTMLIERPWARAKTPASIPDPVTAARFVDLDQVEFAEVLRDHLVPRHQHGPERERWEQMWELLARDDELADRALDVLEGFLDRVEEAKAGGLGEVDEAEVKRIRKFEQFANAGWNRLERPERPLAWAGAGASAFNGPARKVIDDLVGAIAAHRRAVGASRAGSDVDEQLWGVLSRLRLDPDLV